MSQNVPLTVGRQQAAKRSVSPDLEDRLSERQGQFPVWIRCPVSGQEFYTGFTRAKLYELAGRGHIRSVSIREPGHIKGCRLFHLRSILDFVARLEREANEAAQAAEQISTAGVA